MQQLNEQLTKGKFQTVIYMYFISLILYYDKALFQ